MYSRHDLVWLTPDGWQAAINAGADDDKPALQRWATAQRPLVLTRRAPDAPPDTVCLGLAPPPVDGIKRRIAVRALSGHIGRSQPALRLAQVEPVPCAWEPDFASFRDQAVDLDLGVFGSLALQTITGLDYLGPDSDIDLLFRPTGRQQLEAGLALLQAHARQLPLDGEIVFPAGAAVAWKEWAGAANVHARVMVKEHGPVRLATVDSLLQSLEH